jgi:hypothetical protein
MEGRLPNFFIIGSARCGTTLLRGLLDQHPQIYFGPTKEPMFFCRRPHHVADPVAYVHEFDGVRDELAVGDSSHAYLSDPDSPATLQAFFPDARIILIVRNPADRARALYLLMRSLGWEHHGCFEDALAAEDQRFSRGRVFPNGFESFWMYMYFRSGLFGDQVERWQQFFRPEHIRVITLYDLVIDPDSILGDLHDFLKVVRLPAPEIERVNPSTGVRWFPVTMVERQLLHRLGNRGIPSARRLEARLHRINDVPVPDYHPPTRDALVNRYLPDLHRFHDLTGIDILAAERRMRDRSASPSSKPSSQHPVSGHRARGPVDHR